MPVEIGLWRIEGEETRAVGPSSIESENLLERLLARDITILGLGRLLTLGRQVITDHGGRIDLLALDMDGVVYVIELKRNVTPREVVAQALDYGSWVIGLGAERVASIFEEGEFAGGRTLDEAFVERFNLPLPDTINDTHRLVIVASELDASTERIVEYLLEQYSVPVNAVFFRHFRDGDATYLARSWLRDPIDAEQRTRPPRSKRTMGKWNGRDYYVMFGHEARRDWEDAREYGYVSGGGSRHWSKPLSRLQPGHRVFVHVPPYGYVGVGEVLEPAVRIDSFEVDRNGQAIPILQLPLRNELVKEHAEDPERAEYLVRVRWDRTVPCEKAYWEPGFFFVRTTAYEFRDADTLAKLSSHFELSDSSPESVAAPPSSSPIRSDLGATPSR